MKTKNKATNQALTEAISNYVDDTISVYLGYGNGSFPNQIIYSVGYHPLSITVGDFNNDYRLDIAITNYLGHDISILLGYVNIALKNETILLTGINSQPRSFVTGDFNNDNQMDIAVANFGTNNIGIFLQTSYFSFTNQTTYSIGSNSRPSSISVGYFNDDTLLDIVVANNGGRVYAIKV